MDTTLENELVSRFPDLFRDAEDNDKSLMAMFGCECSDGWYQIIYQACYAIDSYKKHTASSPYDQDHKDNVALFRWSQIKEKFGTLRLYHYGGDAFISGVIDMAEQMSSVTCEVCGAPGKATSGGWIRTLCDACNKSGK
jgi:hypothetical protein